MIVMEEQSTSSSAATQLSRQQILETTARCLTEEGYDGATIRRIASKLDCAAGSIYRYFRDKRDLLDAVAQASLEPVALKVEAGASVEESARLYHRRATGDLAMYRLMYWVHTVGAGAGATDVMPDVVRRILTGWARRLGDEPLATRCWMMMHGGIMSGMEVEQVMMMLGEMLSPRAPKAPAMLASPVVVAAVARPAPEPDYLASEDVVLL